MSKDLYEALGVSRSANADEIKKAYRKLAKEHHPDKKKGDDKAAERFKEVARAYEVLGDAEKRKLYDEFGEVSLRPGFDAERARAYRAHVGGAGGGPGFGAGFRWSSGEGGGFSGFSDIQDIFEAFGAGGGGGPGAGGFGRRRPAGPRRGADLTAELAVDLLDAIRGTTLTVQVGGKTVDVKLPAGVADGGRIRLAGLGNPGANGGPPGDLIVHVHVRPHERLRREDADLHMDVPITVHEALAGAKIEVPIPGGGSVDVKVPAGSQTGKTLRLRGLGAPKPGRDEKGDLHLHLLVHVPEGADGARAVELAEQLEKLYGKSPRAGLRL